MRIIPTVKCTCPRTSYSRLCAIEHHKAIAEDMERYSNIKWYEKPTRIERITSWLEDLMDSKEFNRAFLILLAGMFILTIGAQCYMRATDTQSLKSIIRKQTEVEKDLRLKNQILLNANHELSGNGVKLPAESTWGLLDREGIVGK